MSETVLIKLPKELKKQLKHRSVQEERTMSEIVTELIDGYINNKKQ